MYLLPLDLVSNNQFSTYQKLFNACANSRNDRWTCIISLDMYHFIGHVSPCIVCLHCHCIRCFEQIHYLTVHLNFFITQFLITWFCSDQGWIPNGNSRLLFLYNLCISLSIYGGARWLSGRVSDSGARGRGFEIYRRHVVSLSKALYSPKILVNYPGSGGSVPT